MSEITDNKDTHYQVMMGSYTVEEFVKQIDDAYNNEGEETKKGILIAPFQRTYQWHQEEHPLYFLDSLNSNIFVMPVILVEHKQQTWIIDGQQRLATLYCYIKGYQPKDNKPIEWKKLIMAIKNKDMNIVKPCEWEKLADGQLFVENKILQTPIGYSFLFNVNHKDNPRLLVEIFDRINNQGIKLSLVDTIRAYGWLYPHIQIMIDNIEIQASDLEKIEYSVNDMMESCLYLFASFYYRHEDNYDAYNMLSSIEVNESLLLYVLKMLSIDIDVINQFNPLCLFIIDIYYHLESVCIEHNMWLNRSQICEFICDYYLVCNKLPTHKTLQNYKHKILSLGDDIQDISFFKNAYEIYKQIMDEQDE